MKPICSLLGRRPRLELLEPRRALTASLDFPTIESSLVDRVVNTNQFAEFRSATSVPSISPVLSAAGSNDLVVTYNGLAGPSRVTAVVLKPRLAGKSTYQIPTPSNNTNHYAFLRNHIQSAKSADAGLIRFPSNYTFNITPPIPYSQQSTGAFAQVAHLDLDDLTDVVIDLNGSTLKLQQKVVGIRIESSERLTIRNGRIEGTAPFASVAEVRSANNPWGFRLEVIPQFRSQIEAEYPNDPPLITVGTVEPHAGGWRIRSEGYAELFTNRGSNDFNRFNYNNGNYTPTSRIEVKNVGDVVPYSPGDHVFLLHENNSGFGVYVNNYTSKGVEDLSFENVDLVNIPGMGINGEVRRGFHMDDVRILANNQSIFGSSSDGVHFNANGGDIVIENSVLGPTGDDKITVKGNYWGVTEVDAAKKELRVEPIDNNQSVNRWGWKDDKVVFIDGSFDVLGDAELKSNSRRIRSKEHIIELKSIPNGIGVGSIIGNIDNSGGRVIIRNSDFHESRSQGVLTQTSNVVIDNNSFAGIGGPAITVEQALEDWYEAVNTRNVLIRDNTFARSSQNIAKPNELIHFNQVNSQGQPVEVIDNVLIANNQIQGNYNFGNDAPVVTSIERTGSENTNASFVEFAVTFNEAARFVSEDDFVVDQTGLNNARITKVEVNDEDFDFGTIYYVTVSTGNGDGWLSIDFVPSGDPNDRVADVEGNRSTRNFTNGESYTIGSPDNPPPPGDSSEPVVTSIRRVNREVISAQRLFFEVTFNEPVTGVGLADFAIDESGLQDVRFVSLAGSGTTYQVRVFTGTGNGSLSIDFRPRNNQVFDSAGNEASQNFNNGETYIIQKTAIDVPPRVASITLADPNPSSAARVGFRVIFTEPVVGLEPEDFVVQQTGLRGNRVTAIWGSGSSYNVRVTTGSGDGTLSIDFDPTLNGGVSSRQSGLVSAAAFTGGASYTIVKSSSPPPAFDVELLYRNKSPNPTTNQIEAHLEVVNQSSQSQNFKGMEIRYYMDPDGFAPIIQLDKTNAADSDLLLDFASAGYVSVSVVDDVLVAPGDHLLARFVVTGGTFDQTNDSSWDPAYQNKSSSTAIDVFFADSQIWGD